MTLHINKQWPVALISHVFILFLFSCANNESVATLGNYDIPFSDTTTQLIYTYVSTPYYDTLSIRSVFEADGNGTTLVQYNTLNGMPDAERHYSIAGGRKKLLREYEHEYPGETASEEERVPGEIRTFREIHDGRKYPTLEVEITFTNSIGFQTLVAEKQTYDGDTILRWNGQPQEAIKFRGDYRSKTFVKYFPFRSSSSESKGTSYFVKGIGCVKFSETTGEEVVTWDLISVEKE
jgi:hypothetical protein